MKKTIFIACLIIITLILLIINVNINNNAKIIIKDSNNNEIIYVNNNHYTNKENIDNIKKNHIEFILAIEDNNFYNHNGFDIKRIFASIYHNITHDTTMGASTITQQYIKNTYLNNKKSIFRKIKEIILAINIENKLTKDEILSEYLSSIYFGNNVYGLTNASLYYYNKNVNELTDYEFVSLIALWNSPSIYSNSLEKWNKKTKEIANRLVSKGLLSPDKISNINLNINNKYIKSNKLFYIDQVMKEFKETGINTGFNQEIVISTDYNSNLEDINSDYNYSLIAYNKSGYIIGCIGNNDYYNSTFNIAINGKRDIGSTIKPILYYEAIKCGFKNKIYKSMPYTYIYDNNPIMVKNNSGLYYGDISMRTALAVSDNIYAMKTHIALGMNTLSRHLKKYGIDSSPIPSLALGSVGLSLYDLCNIYYQFFNNGYYLNSRFIKSIYTKGLLNSYKPKTKIINNKEICKEINELLKAPFSNEIKHSTCGSINNKLLTECRGKTGSTEYDSYIIGYSNEHLIGIWSGDMESKPISSIEASLPKALFVEAMNKLNKNKNPKI